MADVAADQQFRVELRLNDQDLADELEGVLKDQGVADVDTRTEEGILPLLLPIVVAAVIGIPALATLIEYIRGKHGCQQIIDARKEPIETQNDCNIRNGKIIIFTKDGDKVEVVELQKSSMLQKSLRPP